MARTVLFIVAAVVAIGVAAVVAGVLLALGVDIGSTPGRALLFIVGWSALSQAWIDGVGRLIDRWTPGFREHSDGLMLGDMRAIQEIAWVDLESEILDADCGYHVHRGAGTREQPWAAGPLECGFQYPQELVATIAPLLLNDSGIAHTCEERGNIVRVTIPRIRDSGFDVTVEATTVGVLVHTGTLFHAYLPFSWDYDHWDCDDEDEEFSGPSDPYRWREPAGEALGLVRDLLSPAARIRERRAAGMSYYAALEMHVRGRWRRRRSVTLLRYPYWGRRDERLWANSHLAPRTAE